MNILQIIDAANGGGAEREMSLIASELSHKGNIVHIIHPPGPCTNMFQNLKTENIIVVEYPLKQSNILKTILFFRVYLKKENIDTIHSHLYFSDFISFVARIGLPVKHVVTLHMYLLKSKCKNIFRRIQIYFFAFLAWHFATKLFAVTNDLKVNTSRWFLLPKSKIFVSLNGVDFKNFKIEPQRIDQIRNKYGIGSDDIVLLNLGILHETKGQFFIVEAFGKYLKNHQHLKCFLLGSDGGIENRLKKLIQEYQLEEQVFLPGYQADIVSWLSLSSIYIHPTLNDALPLSLIEAMYLKKPVVVTNLPTLSDLVVNNRTGIVINKKSSSDIADAVNRLLNNVDLFNSLSQNGYNFVLNNCDISTVVEKIKPYF